MAKGLSSKTERPLLVKSVYLIENIVKMSNRQVQDFVMKKYKIRRPEYADLSFVLINAKRSED